MILLGRLRPQGIPRAAGEEDSEPMPSRLPLARRAMLSVFGIGRVPLAPGTAASGVAILAHWCIVGALESVPAAAVSASLAAAFALATLLWGADAERRGGKIDPGWIVSDEIAGQLVAVIGIGSLPGLALAFFGFRFFDVAKPFPIGRLQRLPGGLGILAADRAAAAVVGGLVRFAAWRVPEWGLMQ